METLIKQAIINIALVPVAWITAKWIFKSSIMAKVSFITICFTLFVRYANTVQLILGGYSQLFTIPAAIITGIFVYRYINKIISKPLNRSINQVKELSDGKLQLDLRSTKSTNELGKLNNALIILMKKLLRVITEVQTNAENVSQASSQLSNASQQLSAGANEQASSIEEISATVEQIANNIEQNMINAQKTENVSKEASERIKLLSEKSEKSAEANNLIAQKMNVINDIALKTDILAVNAAIEAARSGEHGKGFAVVAYEVRKLAEKSKKASDEIIALVASGVKLSEEARNLMQETVPKIDKTTILVQEITASSSEQNKGILQVSQAMQQLNAITQQNAASSQEMAASAEELSGQAQQLRDVIAFFQSEKN